jgi:hypothetical protein
VTGVFHGDGRHRGGHANDNGHLPGGRAHHHLDEALALRLRHVEQFAAEHGEDEPVGARLDAVAHLTLHAGDIERAALIEGGLKRRIDPSEWFRHVSSIGAMPAASPNMVALWL